MKRGKKIQKNLDYRTTHYERLSSKEKARSTKPGSRNGRKAA